MPEQILKLESKLKYEFKDKSLLKLALVHRSYINEHPEYKRGHNERVEYLGDAVLELVVSEYLYNKFSDATEGKLTNWRASLVNTRNLSEVAHILDLNSYLYLSKGEAKDKKGKARAIILANALEALIGALYLDKGIVAARQFIKTHIISRLDHILEHELHIDPKSKLQEIVQERLGVTPSYRVLKEEGPDHNKVFTVGVYFGEKCIVKGKGTSKQLAQEDAATNALKKKI
jgi:ribonuclease III